MPYLEQRRKTELELGAEPETPGDLNYLLTTAAIDYTRVRNTHEFEYRCGQYVGRFLEANGGFSYTNYNNAIGALVCARLEWERRATAAILPSGVQREALTEVSVSFKEMVRLMYEAVVAPYEDTKIEQNGDVYPCD